MKSKLTEAFSSLAVQLTLAMTALVLVAVAGTSLLSGLRDQQTFRAELEGQAESILDSVSIFAADPLYFMDIGKLKDTEALLREADVVDFARFYDPDGRILTDSRTARGTRNFKEDIFGRYLLETKETVIEWHPDRLVAGRAVTAGRRVLGAVSLEMSTAPLDDKISAVRNQGIVVAIGTLLLGAALALLVASSVTGPVSALVRATNRVAGGDLSQRIVVRGSSELMAMARAFNHMGDQLQQTLARLRESEERYALATRGANDGVWDWDLTQERVHFSPRWKAMLGYREDEIGSEPGEWLNRVHPEDAGRLEEALAAHLCGRTPQFECEYRMRHKDGGYRWVLTRGLALWDADGKAHRCAGSQTDVTESKKLQEQLLRGQRLQTAGRIAGQVAHDFNNLLGPLVGYPDLIRAQLPEGHPALRFCDAMQEAAETMAAINEDMMTLGRRGRLEDELLDVNTLVRSVLRQCLPGYPASIACEVDLAADLLPVRGSAAQLSRVLANLISNARDSMPDGGVLALRTENLYLDTPMGNYQRIEVGEYVRIQVSDTGCGIEPEIRDKIFDAFFTTKQGARRGAGLGLSVVMAIVEDHRGYLDFESKVGKGTVFSIYLPASREGIAQEDEEGVVGGTESVLVVDDDQVQREVLSQLLASLGYEVESAAGGEEAVARTRERAFDLLILDMIMPGMNGAETYRQILRTHHQQRAIILSGFSASELVQQTQAMGAGAYIRKPVTREKLAGALRRELDRSRQPGRRRKQSQSATARE